jgi:uncharacterized protein YggE
MKNILLAVGAGLVVMATCGTVHAQNVNVAAAVYGGGIAVTGMGEVTAKPDMVEINVRSTGSAEITDDAIVKHHDSTDRIQKAFDGLKLDHLTAKEINVSVKPATSKDQAQMIMRGMPQTSSAPPQVEVGSTIRVRVGQIAAMQPNDLMKMIGKLLDAAKDSGATVGPSDEEVSMAYRYGRTVSTTLVRFVISDADKMKEAAYKLAVEDAKSRAQRLASLQGLTLGPVLSVQEVSVSGDDNTIIRQQQPWETAAEPTIPNRSELTADSMAAGTFRVRLAVRFGIDSGDKSDKKAAADSTSKSSSIVATSVGDKTTTQDQ